MTMSSPRHEPLFDVHPVTGATIEIFFADRTLESFGRNGAGWFWWQRQRGFAPDGPAIGPFPTSYSAYQHALTSLVALAAVFKNGVLDERCFHIASNESLHGSKET